MHDGTFAQSNLNPYLTTGSAYIKYKKQKNLADFFKQALQLADHVRSFWGGFPS